MKTNLPAIVKATTILSAVFVLGLPLPGLAATRTTTQSGDWVNNATWNNSAYPTAGDTATINGNYTVTLTNNETVSDVGTITLGSTTKGTLTLSNGLTRLSTTNLTMAVGGNTLNVHGGLLSVGATTLYVGNGISSNSVNISAGGQVTNGSTVYVGYRGNDNSAKVTGDGSRWDGGVYFIVGSLCTNSSLTIADGGVVSAVANSGKIGELAGSYSNSVLVTDPTSRWTVKDLYVGQAGNNGRLTITNGGQVAVTAALPSYIGAGANTANGNRAVVTGSGSSWGLYSLNIGAISTATTTNMCNNSLWVDQGGAVTGSSTLAVGTTTNSNNNGVLLTKGGLMEFTGITVGNVSSTGNYVTNQGGILQFTSAKPTITVNNSPQNTIVITNGTVSFRNVNPVNLTTNWANAGIGTNTVVWQGANTLRLDNSIGTNTLANGYTFNDNLGPTNYAGLELVNGTTAVAGNKAVTIGANGSLLFSNTTAVMWGAVTNYGTLRIYNSSVTFKTNLTLGAGCTATALSSSQLPIVVEGVLRLDGGTVNLPSDLGADDTVTLFTSSNAISGSVASLTVLPDSHRMALSGDSKALVLRPRLPGSVFMVD